MLSRTCPAWSGSSWITSPPTPTRSFIPPISWSFSTRSILPDYLMWSLITLFHQNLCHLSHKWYHSYSKCCPAPLGQNNDFDSFIFWFYNEKTNLKNIQICITEYCVTLLCHVHLLQIELSVTIVTLTEQSISWPSIHQSYVHHHLYNPERVFYKILTVFLRKKWYKL